MQFGTRGCGHAVNPESSSTGCGHPVHPELPVEGVEMILVNDLAGTHVLAEKVDSIVCGPKAQEVSESKRMVSTVCAVTCGKAAGSPDSDVVSDTSGQVIRFVFLVKTYL